MESRHSILPQTQTQSEKQSEHKKNLSSAKMKSTNFQITTFELEKLQIVLTFLASNVVLRLCPNYKHAPFIKRCCTKHQHIFALFINSAAHQILKYAIFFMSHACDLNVKAQLESNASTIFFHHTVARRKAGLQRRFYISAVIHVRQYRKQSHKLCTNRVPNRFLSQGRLRKSVFSATCYVKFTFLISTGNFHIY